MINPAPVLRSFSSIEHLGEVTQNLGWPTEYRQLKPGSFSSEVADLEGDGWFLMSEQSSLTVEVEAGAPPGMFVLAVVENAQAVMNGRVINADHFLLLRPDAPFRVTLPGGIKATQVGVAPELLDDIVQAVAPDLVFPQQGLALFETAPGRAERVRQVMSNVLRDTGGRTSTQEAVVSNLLADVVADVAETTSTVERRLHGAAARQALADAKEYIEAHLGEKLRVASVCRYARVDLRTLERIFAREFGVSPQQYVKARRLNAVRSDLISTQGLRITDVAVSHGLQHLGRFAGDYFRYFGEYPRETLQRSP